MRNEQGAITIHVAIALIALLAFSSFVIDYGVLWVSRRQAQNAADAGALAGAVSLIRDGGATPTATTGTPPARPNPARQPATTVFSATATSATIASSIVNSSSARSSTSPACG